MKIILIPNTFFIVILIKFYTLIPIKFQIQILHFFRLKND